MRVIIDLSDTSLLAIFTPRRSAQSIERRIWGGLFITQFVVKELITV